MDDMKLTKEDTAYLMSLLEDKIESLRIEYASNGMREFQEESIYCLMVQHKLSQSPRTTVDL